MEDTAKTNGPFDILVVTQSGRLTYEAVLFAASLRHSAPNFAGRLIAAEPQPGSLWPSDPWIDDPEAEQPFVFSDTHTLITGPIDELRFDFDRPSASMAREAT